MKDIEIFKHEQFGEIRTMTDEQGEPWFVGIDVARALGYTKGRNALATHVDDEDKTTALIQGPGSNYKCQAILINESGMYSLVFSSKLESARKFKRWVTNEVLPQIRKTGGYNMNREPITNNREPVTKNRYDYPVSDVDILAKAVLISTKQIEMLTEQVAEMAPKAEYCDTVLDSVSCMTTTQIAKELEMSAIALNKFLCEQGIQYWQSGQYLLYADYARRGYAANRTYTFGDDEVHTRTSLVWTERGREFIHRLVKN